MCRQINLLFFRKLHLMGLYTLHFFRIEVEIEARESYIREPLESESSANNREFEKIVISLQLAICCCGTTKCVVNLVSSASIHSPALVSILTLFFRSLSWAPSSLTRISHCWVAYPSFHIYHEICQGFLSHGSLQLLLSSTRQT